MAPASGHCRRALPLNPDEAAAAFVDRETSLRATALVPEIRLHLATEVTPLWEATEATLEKGPLPPPYWAFAWVGGQALARYVLDHPELVRGRVVLDFASGSGIVAIACALAGAARVVASEIDVFAAAAIRRNAAVNRVDVDVLAEDVLDAPPQGWDAVLAGDVCYEKPMASRAAAWLGRLASGGALVLLADPGRAYLPASGLEAIARYTVPTTREIEASESRETVVYRCGAGFAAAAPASSLDSISPIT
ncbi:MAG: methyltransferase [Alphaproteobacteria bacterium]|nr:methyltransferase [Alphaproteobacteria bacterium]